MPASDLEQGAGRALLRGHRLAGPFDEIRSANTREATVLTALRARGFKARGSFHELAVLFASDWRDADAKVGIARCVPPDMRWSTWHARSCESALPSCAPLPAL